MEIETQVSHAQRHVLCSKFAGMKSRGVGAFFWCFLSIAAARKSYWADLPYPNINTQKKSNPGYLSFFPPFEIAATSSTTPEPSVSALSAHTSFSGPQYVKQEFVVTSDAESVCPEGFTMSGDMCSRYDNASSQVGCPEGWQYDAGICRGVETSRPRYNCDEGYEMSRESCVKMIKAPKIMICPVEFELSKYGCQRNVEMAPKKICPPGHQLTGGSCIRRWETPPAAMCPDGYESRGSDCIKESTAPGTYNCAENMILEGHSCKLIEETPVNLFCADGHQRVYDRCQRIERLSVQFECPTSYTLTGSNCVQFTYSQPLMECPEGYIASGSNSCRRRETTKAEKYCPHAYSFDPACGRCIKGKHSTCQDIDVTLNSAESIKKLEFLERKRNHIKWVYPETRCPAGYVFAEGETCVGERSAQLRTYCPAGQSMDQGRCAAPQYTPPQPICPTGTEMVDSMCQRMHYSTLQQNCPTSFELQGSVCVKSTYAEAQLQCDNGFVKGRTEGVCVMVELGPADFVCPKKAELTESIAGRGRICVGQLEEEPQILCPPKFRITKTHEPRCQMLETAAPEFICGVGFFLKDDECIRFDEKERHTLCPEDMDLVYGQCIKHLSVEPVNMCPRGYDLAGNMCVHEMKAAPVKRCPADYQYDSLTKKCFQPYVEYSLRNEKVLPLVSSTPEKEALKDLTSPAEGNGSENGAEIEAGAPLIPAIAQPPRVTVIQQPIPVPQPQIILPQQAPEPLPIPRPIPVPIPVPVRADSAKLKKMKVNVPKMPKKFGGPYY